MNYLHSSYKALLPVAIFFAAQLLAGCSSGPDIKPPPRQAPAQATAPTAEIQATLSAMDQQLVSLWQEHASTQARAARLSNACESNDSPAGDLDQQTQLRLQRALENQQKALQTLSAIMKQMHAEAMAAARQAGG